MRRTRLALAASSLSPRTRRIALLILVAVSSGKSVSTRRQNSFKQIYDTFECHAVAIRRLLQHTANQLIQDRWQKRAYWFVVKAFAHQSHWLLNSQTIAQAPPKQLAVARGKKESWSGEFFGRANKRFNIFVGLAY